MRADKAPRLAICPRARGARVKLQSAPRGNLANLRCSAHGWWQETAAMEDSTEGTAEARAEPAGEAGETARRSTGHGAVHTGLGTQYSNEQAGVAM